MAAASRAGCACVNSRVSVPPPLATSPRVSAPESATGLLIGAPQESRTRSAACVSQRWRKLCSEERRAPRSAGGSVPTRAVARAHAHRHTHDGVIELTPIPAATTTQANAARGCHKQLPSAPDILAQLWRRHSFLLLAHSHKGKVAIAVALEKANKNTADALHKARRADLLRSRKPHRLAQHRFAQLVAQTASICSASCAKRIDLLS
eukprot:1396077-Pleurochrysis_carterae.AAC.2